MLWLNLVAVRPAVLIRRRVSPRGFVLLGVLSLFIFNPCSYGEACPDENRDATYPHTKPSDTRL